MQANSKGASLGAYCRKLDSLDPSEVIAELKRGVLGQDVFLEEFVPFLCLAIKRCTAQIRGVESREVPRLSSAFIVGPTASGKTHTMKEICKAVDIDLQFIDCSSLTGAGWRGNSVDTELLHLAKAQQRNPGRVTLLVWDEADKMRFDERPDERSFNAQHTLLKPLDGGIYHFEGAHKQVESVDMSRVVNVFAGAFTGIEEVVQKRQDGGAATMGFLGTVRGPLSNEDVNKRRADIWIEDFIEWGMMPELCGRCGAVFNLPALDLQSMKRIVKGSERSLEAKYGKLVPPRCSLAISDDAAELVAQAAIASPVGVRLLENLLNKVMGAAIAEAARRDATSIVVAKAEGGALGYELGFDPAPEDAGSGAGQAQRARAGGKEAEASPQRIAMAIDKDCALFDLEYFLAGGKNAGALAHIMARQAAEHADVFGGGKVSRECLEAAFGMLMYAVLLQQGSRVSLGGLYAESERALSASAYLDDVRARQEAFFDADGEAARSEEGELWGRRVRASNQLVRLGEKTWTATLETVRYYVRYLTIPERMRVLKDAVYERFPLGSSAG